MLTLCDIRIRRFRERSSAGCRRCGLGIVFWIRAGFGEFEAPRAFKDKSVSNTGAKSFPCWHLRLKTDDWLAVACVALPFNTSAET